MRLDEVAKSQNGFMPIIHNTTSSAFPSSITSAIHNEEWITESIKDWQWALLNDREKLRDIDDSTAPRILSDIPSSDKPWLSYSLSNLDDLLILGSAIFRNSRPLQYDEAVALDDYLRAQVVDKKNNGS